MDWGREKKGKGKVWTDTIKQLEFVGGKLGGSLAEIGS